MLDLPISPFLVDTAPDSVSAASVSTPPYHHPYSRGGYAYDNSFLGAQAQTGASDAQDFGSVFCSPPRQSFQLLLRGGEDPVLKDELELLPPRRTSARVRSSSIVSQALTPLPLSSSKPIAAPKRPKRAPVPSASKARASGGSSTTTTAAALQLQQKKRPKRKASYLARKEEKEALLKHLDELQGQLNTLKYQTVVRGGYRTTQPQARKRLTKNILTDAIQKHQLAVAGLQAMLSNYSSIQEHSPIETTIRLGSDPHARRETLLQLKEYKIREAKHYLAERSRGLDETKTYSEEERFETPGGDLCSLRFEVIPVRGARSVKAVFDAMLFYISNIEITISETLGHITIREDDDSSDGSISHLRLVTRIDTSIQSESNTVLFSEYVENGKRSTAGDVDDDGERDDSGESGLSDGFGVIASDFVDEDEQYPYRPLERVRRDVSSMMTVSPHIVKTKKPKKKISTPVKSEAGSRSSAVEASDQEDGESEDEELIVVLKRWSLAKLHKSDLPIPSSTLQEIRDTYGRWSDEMLRNMRHTLLNPGFSSSSSSNSIASSGLQMDLVSQQQRIGGIFPSLSSL